MIEKWNGSSLDPEGMETEPTPRERGSKTPDGDSSSRVPPERHEKLPGKNSGAPAERLPGKDERLADKRERTKETT